MNLTLGAVFLVSYLVAALLHLWISGVLERRIDELERRLERLERGRL